MKKILCSALLVPSLFLWAGCPARVAEAPPDANGGSVERGGTPPPLAKTMSPEWSVDTDGNEVPDFIETELGYDPAVDDCPLTENCGLGAVGTEQEGATNTLLMLDSSGSMNATAGGVKKIDAAKNALKNFVANAGENVAIGFMAYGHKGNNQPAGKAESCAATGAELLSAIGQVNRAEFAQTLERFQPTGWTPIAGALEQARAAFAGKTGRNRIIMVSDGIETCGGDPVAAARQLNAENIKVIVDVVGFAVGAGDKSQLRQIAEAGGGTYTDVRDGAELDKYLQNQLAAYKKTMEDLDCLQKAVLRMQACESEFFRKVAERINREIDTITPGDTSGKYGDLSVLKSRIFTKQNERLKSYAEIQQRIAERSEQSREILRQNLRTLGKMR